MKDQSSPLSIRKATPADIPSIQHIAYATWPIAYGEILSAAQLDYMLELIYSTSSLQEQFDKGHHIYMAENDNNIVGFCSFFATGEPGEYKLSKLYVLPQTQGTGAGKALLHFFMEKARELGATSVILNVNIHNKAKGFYEKNGFTVSHKEDIDIGNGYFMNDYVMRLDV